MKICSINSAAGIGETTDGDIEEVAQDNLFEPANMEELVFIYVSMGRSTVEQYAEEYYIARRA